MYKIITNNKSVYSKYQDVEYVDTDFRGILIKARDYIHSGYSLEHHPLPASIRMLLSPYRTIILSDRKDTEESTIMLEKSIEQYDMTLGKRTPDYNNGKDYEIIDMTLMESTIKELTNFKPKRR